MIKCFFKAVSAEARKKPNVLFIKKILTQKRIKLLLYVDKRQILALLIKDYIRNCDNGFKYKLNIKCSHLGMLSSVFIVLFHWSKMWTSVKNDFYLETNSVRNDIKKLDKGVSH